MAIVLGIAYTMSGCGDSSQPIPAPTIIQPTMATTQTPAQLPTQTNTPEPTAIQTQTPLEITDWQQVWSDEFNATTLNHSFWTFETGPVNDTVHYFTDRPENAQVVDGKLQIIALEESYQGFNYTAALLNTSQSVNWRYGRIEARIKLPSSNGFVPAFWMMPVDDYYGWWAFSGEIDIMEHPTNQIDKIFGTVHTGDFNVFTGSSPRGGTIQIPDAETDFHIYAIEWSEEKIDFFVDDQNYFSFQNEQSGFEAWPFDQPFYAILSMAVGGGWVGNPSIASVFPAIMEIDYIRVYQDLNDVSIYGPDFITANSKSISYFAPAIEDLIYKWSVPAGGQIVSGQGTPQIMVDWGVSGGDIELTLERSNGPIYLSYPVEVSPNILKNGGFEKGAKYWQKSGVFPNANITITTDDFKAGTNAVYVDIINPVANAWDVQLSQGNLLLEKGNQYRVRLWAKSDYGNPEISIAIINSTDFALYKIQSIELSTEWKQYEMLFSVPSNTTASLNIDLGEASGRFYFDNIEITIP